MRAPHTEPDRDGDEFQMLTAAALLMAIMVTTGVFFVRLIQVLL